MSELMSSTGAPVNKSPWAGFYEYFSQALFDHSCVRAFYIIFSFALNQI